MHSCLLQATHKKERAPLLAAVSRKLHKKTYWLPFLANCTKKKLSTHFGDRLDHPGPEWRSIVNRRAQNKTHEDNFGVLSLHAALLPLRPPSPEKRILSLRPKIQTRFTKKTITALLALIGIDSDRTGLQLSDAHWDPHRPNQIPMLRLIMTFFPRSHWVRIHCDRTGFQIFRYQSTGITFVALLRMLCTVPTITANASPLPTRSPCRETQKVSSTPREGGTERGREVQSELTTYSRNRWAHAAVCVRDEAAELATFSSEMV